MLFRSRQHLRTIIKPPSPRSKAEILPIVLAALGKGRGGEIGDFQNLNLFVPRSGCANSGRLKKFLICNRSPQLGLFSEHGEFIVKIRVLEMRVLGYSIGLLPRRTTAHEFSYNTAIAKNKSPLTPARLKSNVVPAIQHIHTCQ